MDIKRIIEKEQSRPMFGGHFREAVKIVRDKVHVRKCNEVNCPRCFELGFNGSGPLHPDSPASG